MPLISIIIPVYKVEQYLRLCLNSIENQTFTDWECILVDDGSPDNSGKICDEYVKKDKRFRVFHQPNSGVSAARNKGLEEARGEYVNFIDSDDWVDIYFLEKIIKFANDYEIVFWGNYNCYEDGNMVAHIPHEATCHDRNKMEQEIYHLKLNHERYEYFGYTWNKLFRLSIIKAHAIRFINGLSIREDELFTMEYCQNITSLKIIPEALYNYRFCMGLSIVKKSSDAYLHYVNQLNIMAYKWQTSQLKKLDLFRYSLHLFGASCLNKNVVKRFIWAIKAYRMKKKYYINDFEFVNAGVFKCNTIVGLTYCVLGIEYKKNRVINTPK